MIESSLKLVTSAIRALGPYLLVEILLPGGTLVALLMWLYQQRRHEAARADATIAHHAERTQVALFDIRLQERRIRGYQMDFAPSASR
jgi:hypothetical protein